MEKYSPVLRDEPKVTDGSFILLEKVSSESFVEKPGDAEPAPLELAAAEAEVEDFFTPLDELAAALEDEGLFAELDNVTEFVDDTADVVGAEEDALDVDDPVGEPDELAAT